MLFNNEYPYTDFHELNLSWVLKETKKVIDSVKSIDGWIEQHEKEYQDLCKSYAELKKLYDDILAGDFPPSMSKVLHDWVVENSQSIIMSLIKTVFFDITPDGYFIAYIPDSWTDIIFGTSGLDTFPVGVEYGHLTLSY